MQRRRVNRGNNAHPQEDGTSRKLAKKPSEEKIDEKEKAKKGVLRKLGFILHTDKQETGSTLKRRKPVKKGTERKRRTSGTNLWNPDKKVHFSIDKAHILIPLKGDPISDIQKKVFLKFATEAVKKSPPEYSVEFLNKVKPYPGQPLERKVFDANPTKNRYKDVVCNDITRVILNDGYDNDYIHANYVNGLNTPFILTQGPTAVTVVDFWRMIFHTKSAYIVMLCDVTEDGKPKCLQYFPDKVGDSVTYGVWTILCSTDDDKDANIMKRTLSVKNMDTGKEHICKHLHTKSWPDRSVPNSTLSLLRMLYIVRTSPGPVTVHCSAGIGRTGTFVAMEACLQILTDGKELDLLGTCRALRNSRAGSIQVDIQYMTLVQVLINYGKDNGYWDDTDLDDRVELLTWNIQQFIQTRGKVDHILSTPSTPVANVPGEVKSAPGANKDPAVKTHDDAEKGKKPPKKDKERTSLSERKERGHPIVSKYSMEDVEEAEDPKMQATQKTEMKDVVVVKEQRKEDEGLVTVMPGPPHPAAQPPRKDVNNNKDNKEHKDEKQDEFAKLGKELVLYEKQRSTEKEKSDHKDNFKLMRKMSANRSQYFI